MILHQEADPGLQALPGVTGENVMLFTNKIFSCYFLSQCHGNRTEDTKSLDFFQQFPKVGELFRVSETVLSINLTF